MADEQIEQDNVVHLRGRVSAVDEPRELSSGDWVLTLRIVVARPPSSSRHGARSARPTTTVDTIDVACWSRSTRRVAGALTSHDVVEVDGALRRRFFRAGGAPASRYEVEASRLRRVRAVSTA